MKEKSTIGEVLLSSYLLLLGLIITLVYIVTTVDQLYLIWDEPLSFFFYVLISACGLGLIFGALARLRWRSFAAKVSLTSLVILFVVLSCVGMDINLFWLLCPDTMWRLFVLFFIFGLPILVFIKRLFAHLFITARFLWGALVLLVLLWICYPNVLLANFNRKIIASTEWVKSRANIFFINGNKLFSVNADGSRLKQEAVVDEKHIWAFLFSPDGRVVLILAGSGMPGWGNYYIVRRTEANAIEKVEMEEQQLWDNRFLGWLPNSRQIAFDSFYGPEGIILYNIDDKTTIGPENLAKDLPLISPPQEKRQFVIQAKDGGLFRGQFLLDDEFQQFTYSNPLETKSAKKLFLLPARIGPWWQPIGLVSYQWLPDSDYVIAEYWLQTKKNILIIDPKTGQVGKLAEGRGFGWWEGQP